MAIASPFIEVAGVRYTIVCTRGDVHTIVAADSGRRWQVSHNVLIERLKANNATLWQ